MPGKDGFEVIQSLRGDPALTDVPVLVVSATSETRRALQVGVRRYLAKPAAAEELVHAVRDLLGPEAGEVLVVDDDADARRLASEALSEHGLRVRTAANGREALSRIAEGMPAVIALDLMMPVMDGFALLDQLNRDPSWRRIPIVVLTAKSLEPKEVEELGRTCAAVIAKGKDDAARLADAVLQAAVSRRRTIEEVVA